MTAATERRIIRWIHIIVSIPVVGFIYGPVAEIPEAVSAIRFVLFPLVVASGLWMWKGAWVKRILRRPPGDKRGMNANSA